MSNIGKTLTNGLKAIAPTVANTFLPGSGGFVSGMLGAGNGYDQGIASGGAGGGGGTSYDPRLLLSLVEGYRKSGIFGDKPDMPKFNSQDQLNQGIAAGNAINAPIRDQMEVLNSSDPNVYLSQMLQGIQQSGGALGDPLNQQIARLDAEGQRVLAQPLGFGKDWMTASQDNLNRQVGQLDTTLNNRMNASMAARGMGGGVMNAAMAKNIENLNNTMATGTNNLNIAEGQAQQTGRLAQNDIMSGLLNQRGGMSNALSSLGTNLLGLQSDIAGKMSGNDMSMLGLGNDLAGKLASGNLGGLDYANKGYQNQLEGYKTESDAYTNAWRGIMDMLKPTPGTNISMTTPNPTQAAPAGNTGSQNTTDYIGQLLSKGITGITNGKTSPMSGLTGFIKNAGNDIAKYANSWGF